MKKHGTVRLTRKWLANQLHACAGGLADVDDLLPVTLSTDPEANLEVAFALEETGRTYRVGWLESVVKQSLGLGFNSEYHHAPPGYSNPGVVAHILAIVADDILTARGA